MISRRQLALAAVSAKRARKALDRRNGHTERDRLKPALVWTWLAYLVAAFGLGLALTYCTVEVLETAARVAS
jgi:hypothetical protein